MKKEQNSLLSSRRVRPDSKFLRFASMLDEGGRGALRVPEVDPGATWTRDQSFKKNPCSSINRKVVGRSSTGPETTPFAPAYPSPLSHLQPPPTHGPPFQIRSKKREEQKKLEWKTQWNKHPSVRREKEKDRNKPFSFSRQRRKTLPALWNRSDDASELGHPKLF